MKNNYKLLNFRPILFIAIAVLISVLFSLLSVFVSIKVALIAVIVVTIIGLFILCAFILKKNFGFSITLVLMIILFLLVSVNALFRVSDYESVNITGKGELVGNIYKIKEVGEDKSGKANYDIVVEGVVDGVKIRANVAIKSGKDLFVGYQIKVKGYFYKITLNYNCNFIPTPLTDGIYYTISNVEAVSVSENIDGVFNKARLTVFKNLKAAFPKAYGLAYAMFTGDSSYVDDDLLEDFRRMGIAHVFAVSGLHIGFVYLALTFVYKALKVNRYLRLIITFTVLFLYVWFCGFSASCIRAFVIVYVISIANALYQKADRLSNVSLSFIICLLINPFDFFTLGFQLSFAVYSAIVFLSKPIYKILSTFCFDRVAKFLAPYLSAYFASLPLVVDAFGYVSIFSSLFNILFVPILSIVYVFVFIVAVSSLFFPHFQIIAVVPNIVLELLTGIIRLISTETFLLTGFCFSYSKYPYYLIGVLNAKFFNLTKKLRLIFTLILFMAFILAIINVNISIKY